MEITPEPKKDISKSQIEIVDKMKKEYKLIGSIKHTPGLTLFSFNLDTLEIKKAVIDIQLKAKFNGTPTAQKKVNVETNCIYREALNVKNFLRKLQKEGIIKFIPSKSK